MNISGLWNPWNTETVELQPVAGQMYTEPPPVGTSITVGCWVAHKREYTSHQAWKHFRILQEELELSSPDKPAASVT